jgi:hypothetical protein
LPKTTCEYKATYTALDDGTNGPFRDDTWGIFCNWSMTQPMGQEYLGASIGPFLASCDGTIYNRYVRFFNNAPDCFFGTRIGEVRFSVKCHTCSE